jgi:hypothetical protein
LYSFKCSLSLSTRQCTETKHIEVSFTWCRLENSLFLGIENCFETQMEILDENEWWSKMEQMKRGGEQEMVIKRNYSRADQQTLSDMAYQLGLYL